MAVYISPGPRLYEVLFVLCVCMCDVCGMYAYSWSWGQNPGGNRGKKAWGKVDRRREYGHLGPSGLGAHECGQELGLVGKRPRDRVEQGGDSYRRTESTC